MFCRLTRRLALVLAAMIVLGAAQIATPAAAQDTDAVVGPKTGIQPDGMLVISPQVAKLAGDYLTLVNHRFGALAVSRTGDAAAFYICRSRLWKNCDDYSLEDSFITIPSGKLAAKLAQSRCHSLGSGDCIVLFINDRWQRPFRMAQ